jgi:hypothetical protein
MISELKDDEILEILMTSDFTENLRPDDYKYLLFKFRSFYKSLYGNYQRYKDEKEFIVKNLKIDVENTAKENLNLQIYNSNLENDLLEFKNPRKLTILERIKGEIEYKRK